MNLEVFESPGRTWDEFASRHSELIFHRSIWADTLKKGLGAQPLYFYMRQGKEIVAGFPSVLLKIGPISLLYSTTHYGGVIGDKKYPWILMANVERELQKRGIDQIRVIDSPFSPAGCPPAHEPFEAIESVCSLTDLTGKTEAILFNGYPKNVRRDIRKAERSGIVVEEDESENGFSFFYLLYLASMARNKAPAKYSKRFVSAFRDLVLEDFGSLFLAKKDGVPIAGMIVLYSEKIAHVLMAGSGTESLSLCPNDLLVHRVLLHCIQEGMTTFDFGGSDVTDQGLIKFKNRFGGKSVPVNTYVKSYSPMKCWAWDKLKPMAIKRAHALRLA